jgi:phosphate starvation-inducible PhoH-like protein
MPTKKTKYDKTTTKTIQRKFKVPQTPNQAVYLDTIAAKEVTICTGPAGCGKTALAVSYATQQLLAGKYKRIIITRPVVESG